MHALLLAALASASFFRANDLWLLQGDSITYDDTYRQIVLAAMDHFHPGCGIRGMNVAVWGQMTGEASRYSEEMQPTVVTIMLGMNDVIHRDYPPEYDFASDARDYAEAIRKQVRDYQAKGAAVVLMKPTWSDETEFSYFAVRHAAKGLEAYGKALDRVSAEESCELIPVGEDFERAKMKLGALETFVADGVHPLGHGQYELARSLIERLGVTSPLGNACGPRVCIGKGVIPVSPVRISRAENLVRPQSAVDLTLESDVAAKAVLFWSAYGLKKPVEAHSIARGCVGVHLVTNRCQRLRIDMPESVFPRGIGEGVRLFVSVRQDEKALAMAVVDLANVRVFDISSGVAEGTIPGVGNWKVELRGPDLWVSGETFSCRWPKRPENDIWMNSCGMNGLQTLFDFRPKERFAENRCDHDVSMVNLNVLEDPWSVMPAAWVGRRVQDCLRAHAEKTERGFSWRMGFRGRVNDYTKFDVSRLDYFGAQIIFQTYDGERFRYAQMGEQLEDGEVRIDPTFFLNATPVFDRIGTLPKPSAMTVSVWTL